MSCVASSIKLLYYSANVILPPHGVCGRKKRREEGEEGILSGVTRLSRRRAAANATRAFQRSEARRLRKRHMYHHARRQATRGAGKQEEGPSLFCHLHSLSPPPPLPPLPAC